MIEGKNAVKNEKRRNQNLTIPNLISVVRILIIPFFAYFYLNDNLVVAVILLLASGLSDMFDGMIARKFNQITAVGKLLDPFADKLTQGVVAICLAVRIPQVRGILMIFIVKELLMLMGGIVLVRKHKRPSAARWYGKVSTFLFYISVAAIVVMDTFMVVEAELFWTISNVLLIVTAVFMIYSLTRYIFVFRDIMKSTDPKDEFFLSDEMKGMKE